MSGLVNNRYIIYFTEAQMYLFSARPRVRSIEVAKKYTNINSAKKAVSKSLWNREKYEILNFDNYTSP